MAKNYPGSEKLKEYMKEKKLSARDLAYVLRAGKQTVHQWVCGQCRPKLSMRYAIKHLAGIDPSDWVTGSEKKEVYWLKRRIDSIREESEVTLLSPKERTRGRVAGRI